MRHTIEYDVEVAANGYDEAVRVAKSLAKDNHLPAMKRALRLSCHNDDEQRVVSVYENDEG